MAGYSYLQTSCVNPNGNSVDPTVSWCRPSDGYHPSTVSPLNSAQNATSYVIPDYCTVENTQYGVFLKCNLCNVNCTSQTSFDQHSAGARHRKHFRHPTEYFCEVCNLSFTDTSQQQAHVRGSRHARRLKQMDQSVATSVGTPPRTQSTNQFHCETCNLDCVSESQLQDHLAGRKHHRCAGQQMTSRTHSSVSSRTSASTPMGSLPSQCAEDQAVQTEPDPKFDEIRQLESDINPGSMSVAACSQKPTAKSMLTVNTNHPRSPKRLNDRVVSPPVTREKFCVHDSCIILRALQVINILYQAFLPNTQLLVLCSCTELFPRPSVMPN
ncbi:hypothetical protein D915_008378 [Fasciola hepatica]|uniref:C2H2-type domain-containing protein n=1 Tax=Fasciola hepatica TaxID=6192 RepID=A0A4E0R5D9_FASHE|nr:hypothetical protein D915_008378 [Fasciola hepatica]